LHLQNGTIGLKHNTLHSVLKKERYPNQSLVSMGSSFSTYQILQMMSDDDFAYLADYNPESVDNMCISLTIELLEGKNYKPD
jgi:hypothetical protein